MSSNAPTSQTPAPASASQNNSYDDPLSDALRSVRLCGALFFGWEVSWPFATPVPDGRHIAPVLLAGAQRAISFHIVTRGECWAGLIGHEPRRLIAGDVLLLPQGHAYAIASSPEACRRATPGLPESMAFFHLMAAGALPPVVVDGEGPISTSLLCGFLGCDVTPFNPFVQSLPPLLSLNATTDKGTNALAPLIALARAEWKAGRPGSRVVLLRLAELMFIEIVRLCLEELPADAPGWLAGMQDPVVGRALGALHAAPSSPWTVERLARAAGTSRSRLAAVFSARVGETPMRYLTRWRIQMAAGMLLSTSATVAAIAHDVGYRSESAFSRAFKLATGSSPAEWRTRAVAPPALSQ